MIGPQQGVPRQWDVWASPAPAGGSASSAGPSGRGVANEGVEAKRYWLLRRPAAQTHL